MTLRRVQAALIIAAASSACVKIEPFRGGDGGTGSDGSGSDAGDAGGSNSIPKAIATTAADGRVSVELAGLYKMEFAKTGYHFPETLTIRGVQVLDPPQASCVTEHGTGVTWAPAATFSSWTSTNLFGPTQSDITVDFDGTEGGIAKVRLDWEAPFMACTRSPSGRSTFTFFPDGRIQRMDTAHINQDANADACGCESGTNWDIATYYAFDEADVANLIGATRPPVGDGNQTSTGTNICFTDANQNVYQVAIGWWAPVARRVRRVATGLAFIANYAPITPDTGPGPLLGDTSTAMIIDSDDSCATLPDRVAPYVDGTTLEITNLAGSTDLITMGQDGIYGGEHSGNPSPTGWNTGTQSTITMRAGNGPVGPFAVWLDLTARPTVTSVTREPASARTEWYTQTQLRLPPPDSATRLPQYLFYFPDGLSGTEQITIQVAP